MPCSLIQVAGTSHLLSGTEPCLALSSVPRVADSWSSRLPALLSAGPRSASAKLVAGLGPASGLGELAALGVGAVGDRVGEVVGCVRDGVVGDVEVVGGDGMVGVDRRAEVFLGCCSVRCPRLHFYASSTRFRHCLLFLFFLLFWLCYRYGYDGDDDVLLPGLGLDAPVVPGRARVLVPGSLDVLHMVSAAGLWVEAGELGGFGEVPDWGPVLEFGSLPLVKLLE